MDSFLEGIPSYNRFFTIDEHERSTDDFSSSHESTTVRVLGHSGKGHPIRSISLGQGKQNVVLAGFPHPNEPVGALMLEYLLEVLSEDDFGFRWHVIKCLDPDGARLNEGWFSREYDLRTHIYNYYRSPSYLQIDWTFPTTYKTVSFNDPLPETLAFKRLLDETRPALLYSLHNSTFGGVYWYLTHRCPEVYPRLHASAARHGLPLYLGEPEVAFAVLYEKAIYEAFTLADEYEYMLKTTGRDPASAMKAGTSSDDYSKQWGTFSVVCEVPYLYHPRVADNSETDVGRREAVRMRLDDERAIRNMVEGILARIQPMNASSPFAPVMRHYLGTFESYIEADSRWAETMAGNATQAELFDNTVILPLQNTLLLGELWRLVDESHPRDEDGLKCEISGIIEERVRKFERECPYTKIPIRDVVAVQLETLFACLDHVRDKSP